MNSRLAAPSLLSARIAYGLGLMVAPGRLTRRWLGDAAGHAGGRVALRALGAREVALHAGALRAALAGERLAPWLAASIAGDLTDVAATTAARRRLPGGSPTATALVGGGSALATGVLLWMQR